MKTLSNLPPGCTDYDIEEQAGAFDLDIQDDDFVINDAHDGYYVTQINETFTEYNDAIQSIVDQMEKDQWWPSVWFVNDHGNTDLLSVNSETLETTIIKSWV